MDWRVDVYQPSVPSAPWSVRVMHVPTGRVSRVVEGRGDVREIVEWLKREVCDGDD